MACATLVAGCPNFPPADDRSFPGAGQFAGDERRESRAFELADSNYHNVVPNERTNMQEAAGYARVYNRRYNMVRRQILVLARLRARAGALFGDELSKRMEELVRKAGSLRAFMQEYVAQIRAGENVAAQWPNQDWNARARDSVTVDPDNHTDPFSLEFEQKFQAVEDLLQGYR